MKKIALCVSIIIFVLFFLNNNSSGDIYKYTDSVGLVHLTNMYGSEPCKRYGCVRVLKEIPPNWERISDNFFYDKTDIEIINNTKAIWTYSFLTDDEITHIEKVLKKRDSDKSLKHLYYNYEAVLCEIDCENKRKKIKKILYVDGSGKVVDYYTKENSEWDNITPQSVFDGLYHNICSQEGK